MTITTPRFAPKILYPLYNETLNLDKFSNKVIGIYWYQTKKLRRPAIEWTIVFGDEDLIVGNHAYDHSRLSPDSWGRREDVEQFWAIYPKGSDPLRDMPEYLYFYSSWNKCGMKCNFKWCLPIFGYCCGGCHAKNKVPIERFNLQTENGHLDEIEDAKGTRLKETDRVIYSVYSNTWNHTFENRPFGVGSAVTSYLQADYEPRIVNGKDEFNKSGAEAEKLYINPTGTSQ